MPDREEVLFANEAFYLSFAAGDDAAMDGLWARSAAVSCLHPGWEALHGRDAVMESWRGIMRAGAPAIRCRAPQVALYGDLATVICYEQVQDDFLVATNIFVREEGAWRMIHHQAGPTRGVPPPEDSEGRSRAIN